MRYFACISYDGIGFYGWQKQAGSDNTVQYHIDHCLSILLKYEITSMGCGRTDAGVHAKNFYLHFDTDHPINVEDTLYRANRMLPTAIAMNQIIPVAPDAHARFDAYERSYVYKIKTQKDPFDPFSHYINIDPSKLDLNLLNELAGAIARAQNFAAFCKTKGSATSGICIIKHAEWRHVPNSNCIEFHITSNRFLRGMIRLLVGAMLNVHGGKISAAAFEQALFNQKPLPIPFSIDGHGLQLYGIKYPYI